MDDQLGKPKNIKFWTANVTVYVQIMMKRIRLKKVIILKSLSILSKKKKNYKKC